MWIMYFITLVYLKHHFCAISTKVINEIFYLLFLILSLWNLVYMLHSPRVSVLKLKVIHNFMWLVATRWALQEKLLFKERKKREGAGLEGELQESGCRLSTNKWWWLSTCLRGPSNIQGEIIMGSLGLWSSVFQIVSRNPLRVAISFIGCNQQLLKWNKKDLSALHLVKVLFHKTSVSACLCFNVLGHVSLLGGSWLKTGWEPLLLRVCCVKL